MLRQLRVEVYVSKGSPITGLAWADVLFGGLKVVDQTEITSEFKSPIENLSDFNKLTFTVEHEESFQQTLTVINRPESIGPIQIYTVAFYLDDKQIYLNWQQAIKTKPLRFGGQPSQIITNPHVDDPKFRGWCNVPNVTPGMSITWGLIDLVTIPSDQ